METPKIDNNPLVSIIIITFNSSKYVLETLESAKAQTYENIELIVSDDCSTDDTVEVCRNWIEKNKERFVRTELITVPANTGIPANCNRGVKASNGEWVKLVAGDDMLHEECILRYIKFIKENNNIPQFLFSNVVRINSNSIIIDDDSKDDSNRWAIIFGSLSAAEQFKLLLKSNKVWASTWMFSKDIYKIVHGFDERYKCYEDRPFMLSVTRNGSKIFYVNTDGTLYRIHNNSVQTSKNILSCFEESKLNFFVNELQTEFSPSDYNRLKRKLYLKKFLQRVFKNKKNIFSSMIIAIFSKLKIV
jgi:alpha-1,3-rhamnosyltransferase